MDKLLVTGTDGMLGANLALALTARTNVVGMARAGSATPPELRVRPLAEAAVDEIVAHVVAERPRWIVHCGAMARSHWDAKVGGAWTVEREFSVLAALAHAARQIEANLAVVSTDAVFAGPRMFHVEADTPNSVESLGAAAQAIEREALSAEALVVRTHAYGFSPDPAMAGFAERTWVALSEGLPTEVDAQCYATPILATDLAETLWAALTARMTGLLHIAGAERTNQHRFAASMAVACGWTGRPVPLISPHTEGSSRRANETSLNTRMVRNRLDVTLPMVREGLERFAEQAQSAWRRRLTGITRSTGVPCAA